MFLRKPFSKSLPVLWSLIPGVHVVPDFVR